MRHFLPVFLILWSLLLAGCSGSGTTSPQADGTPEGEVLLGRAQSDVPLVGARVELLDRSGQPLLPAPLVVGANGLFETAHRVSGSFLVVVTPPQNQKIEAPVSAPLTAVVEDWDLEMVGVNFVTNLVSLYLAEHPGLTLAEAEQRVRTFLQIPEGVDLGTGLDADSGWFSRTVFARRAAANGGVQAYSQSLVQQVDTGGPVPFVLAAEESSVLGDLAESVASNLISDPISHQLQNTFGWAASLAGFNIGGPSMSQISSQLDQISNQLTQIQAEIAQQTLTSEYTADQVALESFIPTIDARSADLSNLAAAVATQGAYPPVTTPPDSTLIQQLQSQTNPSWDVMANTILDYLLHRNSAPNNMVNVYSGIIMASVGADSAATYQGSPLRSNALLRQQQDQMNYYLQEVNRAINLYAETAHLVTRDSLSGNFTSNAVPIMLAKATIWDILGSSRQCLQQLPVLLPSDEVLVDTEYGVTWYLTLQPPDSYDDIRNGSKIVTGPYGSKSSSGTRFMVASKAQLDGLRNRLRGATPPVGNPTQTLAKLGFKGVTGTDLKVWMYSPDYNMGFGKQDPHAFTYDLNTGNTDKLNTFDNPATYPYLVALPFPGAAETSPLTPLLSSGKPGTLAIQAVSPTQLKAVATNNPVTSGGTFSAGGSTQSVPVTTVVRASDDVTQAVRWSSSTPEVADISNLDGSQGLITWHPNVNGGLKPVTFTASFLGATSATLVVNPPNPAPTAQLVSIQVLPSNLLYGLPARNEYYQATGFYSDQTAVNLNSQVTWSVVGTNGNTPIPSSQAGFTTNEPNLLVISPTLATSQLTVRATLGGVTGSAAIEVPVQNP